jgi:Na+-translocating ferredoxin:NAD+ oxidoreductase RnfG subunit
VQIHTDKLTEDQAFELEKQLIKHYREKGTLANVTDGGGGVSGSHVNLGVAKTQTHKEKLRQVNIGKKQSRETIEKRKKSMEKLADKGWINPGKREECKRIGVKNNNFAGFYVTPNGVYESINSAAKANNCTEKAIRVRCRGNICIVKGVKYTYPPRDGWSFAPKEIA